MRTFDTNIFDEPGLHVIRLGNLALLGDAFNITVVDHSTGTVRRDSLDFEQCKFVGSIDPTDGDRHFSANEEALLLTLEAGNFVTFVLDTDRLMDLSFVPAPRRVITLEEPLEQGYRMRVADGGTFVLSEVGGRFLRHVDGRRTLATIAAAVKEELLADPKTRDAVRLGEVEAGHPLDTILIKESLIFVKVMTESGVGTFEPAMEANEQGRQTQMLLPGPGSGK